MAATDPPMKAVIVAGTTVMPWMAPIAYGKLAEALDAPVHTLQSAGWAHTMLSVAKLERELEQLDDAPVLVGHSQGGLVALLLAQYRPDLAAGVITLGAPVKGTTRADLRIPIPGVRCMAVDSRVVNRLDSADDFNCRVVNIVGARDAMVIPHWTGFLDGADHYTFDVGHLGLIFNGEVVDFVRLLVRSSFWPG